MSNIRNGMDASALTGAKWIKSSHSGPTGGNCVEVASRISARTVMREAPFSFPRLADGRAVRLPPGRIHRS
jgi:hypothetical protein